MPLKFNSGIGFLAVITKTQSSSKLKSAWPIHWIREKLKLIGLFVQYSHIDNRGGVDMWEYVKAG
jgi:hypothetical protein